MNQAVKKILIIDDEVDLCILMRHYLVQRQYEVSYAHTLKEGMSLFQHWKPDVIFLDNNLPDGTGWSKIDDILQVKPDLKIFLMSGYHPVIPDHPQADITIIPKPISFADLQTIL